MVYKYKVFMIRVVYVLVDFFLIYGSLYLACLIRADILPFDVTWMSLFSSGNPFRLIFIFWIGSTILSLNNRELYQTKREMLEVLEVGKVVNAVFMSSLVVVVAIFSLKAHGFPRSIFLLGTVLMMVSLSIWRIIKRQFVEFLVAKGYNNFNAVIIGAGKVGVALADQIRANTHYGIKIVGFLDDFKTGLVPERTYPILGKINEFPFLARREFVDIVFVSIHHDHQAFVQLLEQAKELKKAVRVVPQGYELISGEFQKYNIGLIPILEYQIANPLRMQFGKRLLDLTVSFLAVILLFPIYFLIMLLIKLDSRGSIFYVSYRYGRGGRKFPMLKFRSMVVDADKQYQQMKNLNEVDGPIFKIKKDPRITRMGRFLRKFSLDELPQIFNVLIGQMSLVGPRPLPVDQVEREDLNQLKRLEVRPGITGLWQVRGRSDISFKRLVRWDIWYINNWSFWLDLIIMLRTVPVVIKGKGAY